MPWFQAFKQWKTTLFYNRYDFYLQGSISISNVTEAVLHQGFQNYGGLSPTLLKNVGDLKLLT